jgi:hypothetical protein
LFPLYVSNKARKSYGNANKKRQKMPHLRQGIYRLNQSKQTAENSFLLSEVCGRRSQVPPEKSLDQKNKQIRLLTEIWSKSMEFKSQLDPTRDTVGSIYRNAQINGERGVVIGDVNHEITKDLVKDINEAIEEGTKQLGGQPFYLSIYEKYDLMLKRGLVRIRKITTYRPYPEQDMIAFHVFPNEEVYFCWELPHRSQMLNILASADLFDPERVSMIRRWENMQLEYFGFTKDAEGFWVENPLFRGDKLLGSPDGQKQARILSS